MNHPLDATGAQEVCGRLGTRSVEEMYLKGVRSRPQGATVKWLGLTCQLLSVEVALALLAGRGRMRNEKRLHKTKVPAICQRFIAR